MEALALALENYKDVIGSAALITTVGQFFSPAFLCNDIRKQGDTENIPYMPFLGGAVIGILNLQFGMMIRDDIMIKVSFAGIFLNILYMTWYYAYSKNKGSVWLQTGLGGAFVSAIIGYTLVEEPSVAENRLGMIVTVLMFTLIASPLFELKEILRSQNTAGMPFPIIFSGTVVSFLWLLHGIILRNDFLICQNIVFFLLGAIQLTLMAIYPAKPVKKEKKDKKTN